MDDLIEFLFECLMNSRRVPKIIKCIIVILVFGAIVWLGINIGLNSETLAGNILGFVFAGVGLIAGIISIIRITRN